MASLAHTLREPAPAASLLRPETIIVPHYAMRQWLQAEIAKKYGVAANLEFLTPGEFVHRILDCNVPVAIPDLDSEQMHWRLWQVFNDQDALNTPALSAFRHYLQTAEPLRAWQLADAMAKTFEKYMAWRRDWLMQWDQGMQPNDAQAVLWRKISSGYSYRARRIQHYLQHFGHEQGALPTGMPSRLFVFATLNISPDVLRVIATQSRVGTLHCYLPTPSRRYWGDLGKATDYLHALEQDEQRSENPLLAAWGRAGRDFMAVLGGYEIIHPTQEIELYADPEALPEDQPAHDNLLGRLQRDLLHRRPPTAWRQHVDKTDNSLQVHACHTPLREVQVLHDQLRGLLEDKRFDPPLQPRDIAVLAPDIHQYIPHIQAVFGAHAGTDAALPYSIADASAAVTEPLTEVFLRLLALPDSAFGLQEIMTLLCAPAIMQKTGLYEDALQQLQFWLEQARLHWGLDAPHRVQHQAPASELFTWVFALDRLLLGYISGEETETGDIAALPLLEGKQLQWLTQVQSVLRTLMHYAEAMQTALSATQWRELLFKLLEDVFTATPERSEDDKALATLRTLIHTFAQTAEKAHVDAVIHREIVRDYFQEKLSAPNAFASLMTGGINFAQMVPLRLIPFRVICVLGMNDGEYPRQDRDNGQNRLIQSLSNQQRRPGDRSVREDDRYLFLQLFTAARDVFYISYQGADPRDNSTQQPSIVVSELLKTIDAYHSDPDNKVEKAFIVQHPLQSFSADNYGRQSDASDPRIFSYQQQWSAVRVPRIAHERSRWMQEDFADNAPIQSVQLTELEQFLHLPAKHFLQKRLGMQLPREYDAHEDIEPFDLMADGLEKYKLQQVVFNAMLNGVPKDELKRYLMRRGEMPIGAYADAQLDYTQTDLQPVLSLFREHAGDGLSQQPAFNLQLDAVSLHGKINNQYTHAMVFWKPSALHGKNQITQRLHWFAAAAMGVEQPLVQIYRDKGKANFIAHQLPALTKAQALQRLQRLVMLYQQGMHTPAYFAAKTGYAWFRDRHTENAWKAARLEWEGSFALAGEKDADALMLAFAQRDPLSNMRDREEFEHWSKQIFAALSTDQELKNDD